MKTKPTYRFDWLTIVVIIAIISMFPIAASAKKQNMLYGPALSYQYQQSHLIKLSGFIITRTGEATFFRAQAGVDFAFRKGDVFVLPEIAAGFYFSEKMIIPFGKVELTPYHVTPKIGASLYTFVDFDLGYGFNFGSAPRMQFLEGIAVSATVYVPLNFKIR